MSAATIPPRLEALANRLGIDPKLLAERILDSWASRHSGAKSITFRALGRFSGRENLNDSLFNLLRCGLLAACFLNGLFPCGRLLLCGKFG